MFISLCKERCIIAVGARLAKMNFLPELMDRMFMPSCIESQQCDRLIKFIGNVEKIYTGSRSLQLICQRFHPVGVDQTIPNVFLFVDVDQTIPNVFLFVDLNCSHAQLMEYADDIIHEVPPPVFNERLVPYVRYPILGG